MIEVWPRPVPSVRPTIYIYIYSIATIVVQFFFFFEIIFVPLSYLRIRFERHAAQCECRSVVSMCVRLCLFI